MGTKFLVSAAIAHSSLLAFPVAATPPITEPVDVNVIDRIEVDSIEALTQVSFEVENT